MPGEEERKRPDQRPDRLHRAQESVTNIRQNSEQRQSCDSEGLYILGGVVPRREDAGGCWGFFLRQNDIFIGPSQTQPTLNVRGYTHRGPAESGPRGTGGSSECRPTLCCRRWNEQCWRPESLWLRLSGQKGAVAEDAGARPFPCLGGMIHLGRQRVSRLGSSMGIRIKATSGNERRMPSIQSAASTPLGSRSGSEWGVLCARGPLSRLLTRQLQH